MKLIAKTVHGLEEVLAEELAVCGARNIEPGRRVVSFSGDKEVLYRANLECRCAIRILLPIHHFRANNENGLYRGIQEVDWSKYLSPRDTLAVDAVCSSDLFTHSKYVSLKTKDAIVDQIRDATGHRPDVNVREPTYRVHIHINHNEVSVSLDSSGQALFKRGFRTQAGDAPINEVLAAGLIRLSKWDMKTPLLDITCGSGTICIEAARMALNLPAHLPSRVFGFEQWRDFDQALWEGLKKDAYQAKGKCPPITGLDISKRAISVARGNASNAEVDSRIQFVEQDFFEYLPSGEPGFIISNPPYDERMQIKDINAFYAEIGDSFKKNFRGWEAWMISSNIPALKMLGLKPSRKIPLFNGPLECRLYRFEMYAGSKKGKWIKKEVEDEQQSEINLDKG